MNSWYLRKPNGSEFGPESIETLRTWAEQSRILAGNEISEDRKNWQKVENIPELNMCHIAVLPDKSVYGPFNIKATNDLLSHRVFTKDTVIINNRTGEETTVSAYTGKNKKKHFSKKNKDNGQADFDLLSTPETELPVKPEENTELSTNTKTQTKKTKKKTNKKMKLDNQGSLFEEENFHDDIQYVTDEDAQLEMPYEEEIITYNETTNELPTPKGSNTVFISKDSRFPDKLTAKPEIMSLDDIRPVEDHRQKKFFIDFEDFPEEKKTDSEAGKVNTLDTQQDKQEEDVKPVKKAEPEEDVKPAEDEPVLHLNIQSDNQSHKKNESISTTTTLEETDELEDLKKTLESTTRTFIAQKDLDTEKINKLTAERNKLEIDISNTTNALNELKEHNDALHSQLQEHKDQTDKLNKKIRELKQTIETQKLEFSKDKNALDIKTHALSDLQEKNKDLSLALAAERDKLAKQLALTEQYQQELDNAEKKHNEIVAEYDEKLSEIKKEVEELEASKENLTCSKELLEQKIAENEKAHKNEIEQLQHKLIGVRQELKKEEEDKENAFKEIKNLKLKIKSTDTIVNERMRTINEEATRISTKYKQECRTSEKLAVTNKRLMIITSSLAALLLAAVVSIVAILILQDRESAAVNTAEVNKETVQLYEKPEDTQAVNIELSGARVTRAGKLIKVIFDEPMFRKLSSPSAFAISNIRNNLSKYKKYLKEYDIIIEGHTDNVPLANNPDYPNNKALGLARARSFKNLLTVSFGLPGAGISVVSAGAEDPPYSNSSAEGREKNKTVVLYFKQKQ